MIMICGFIIGFAVAYIVLDVYVVKPYAKDYADLVLKSGKDYARQSDILSKLLKDRENVRELLLEYGVIKWENQETIEPGEKVILTRCLIVQKDSDIIKSLLERRKRLLDKTTLNDVLMMTKELNINKHLNRWPEYME